MASEKMASEEESAASLWSGRKTGLWTTPRRRVRAMERGALPGEILDSYTPAGRLGRAKRLKRIWIRGGDMGERGEKDRVLSTI